MDVIEVCKRLTPEQKQSIKDKCYRLNPRMRGAPVEDILDMLENYDSDCQAVSNAYAEFPVARGPRFRFAALALIWSDTPITEQNLLQLVAHATQSETEPSN